MTKHQQTMTLDEFLEDWNSPDDCITVHTSGSTGKPKAMSVEKARMMASAAKTCRFLSLDSGDSALLCMPLDYIAGKMVVVRSLVSGMRLVSVPPSSHPLRGLDAPPSFAAMVPLQVYCSMQVPEELDMLRRIKHLLIGGGAVDPDMERSLRSFPNAVWSTYGMTETLSHIALRRLSGDSASEYYTPFDGVRLWQGDDDCLCIEAPDVCPLTLHTRDMVEFHPDGLRFRIVGRKDNVIVSGGIKIHIEEVEQLLAPHITRDFAVSKRPDHRLGEMVVLLIAVPEMFSSSVAGISRTASPQIVRVDEKADEAVPAALRDEWSSIRKVLSACLPRYWQPKEIYAAPSVPHTGTGKIARTAVLSMVGKV